MQQIHYPFGCKQSCLILCFRIEDAEKQGFKHCLKVIVLFVRLLEQVEHIIQIPVHPPLPLNEMKECYTPHHLFDVIAHSFILVREFFEDSFVSFPRLLLNPLVAFLHKFLSCNILDKFGVLLSIYVEELIRECFNGKGIQQRLVVLWTFGQGRTSVYRSPAVKIQTEEVGISFGVSRCGVLFLLIRI